MRDGGSMSDAQVWGVKLFPLPDGDSGKVSYVDWMISEESTCGLVDAILKGFGGGSLISLAFAPKQP